MKPVDQDQINSTYSNINRYQIENTFTDVEIVAGDAVFRCHRLILAAASPHFHALFTQNRKPSIYSARIEMNELPPNIIREVLKFIYGGGICVTNETLFNMARASDLFKLRGIEESCAQFVRENFVAERPLKNALALFSSARSHGLTELAPLLAHYIHKNLHYFSKEPMFVELKLDDVLALLNLIPAFSFVPHDAFFFAILKWIRYAQLTPYDRKLGFDRLLRRIDFSKLSSACVEYVTRLAFEDFTVLRTLTKGLETMSPSSDGCILEDYENEQMPDGFLDAQSLRLHAYVNAYSEDEQEFETKVFTLYPQLNEESWIQPCWLDCVRPPLFMRNVTLDDKIYCLSFLGISNAFASGNGSGVQSFRVCSSVSLFSYSYLSPPPVVLDDYDMCGENGSIFVYGKNTLSEEIKDETCATFDQEHLRGGVYRYNRYLDRWSPLAAPKHKYANACMASDGPLVYLIGGTNSNKVVQRYDIRTSAWTTIAQTAGIFENAACCVLGHKLYVSGGIRNRTGVEMYDPTAGKWEKKAPMRQARSHHKLITFSLPAEPHLVTGGRALSAESEVEVFNVTENTWIPLVSLYKPLINSTLKFRQCSKVIDMIMFKPYGS